MQKYKDATILIFTPLRVPHVLPSRWAEGPWNVGVQGSVDSTIKWSPRNGVAEGAGPQTPAYAQRALSPGSTAIPLSKIWYC